MSWLARQTLADIAWSELEVEFWERHADRLTLDERSRIAHGDRRSLHRPIEPEWSTEDWLPVASNLWIKPAEAMVRESRQVYLTPTGRRARATYIIPFSVRDHRPRLIRRNPHAVDFAAIKGGLDEYGTPRQVSEQDGAEAEEASHYTSSSARAIPDAGEAIDREAQELYAAEAAVKRARGDSDQVRDELERIKRLPARSRIIELHKLASERGVDVRDEVKAFERRMMRRLDQAA